MKTKLEINWKNIQITIFLILALGLPPLGLIMESTQLTGFGFYALDVLILVMIVATHSKEEQ